MRQSDIATMFDYMYWVNHRLLDHVSALTNQQFVADSAVNSRSLRATLVHELDVEWSWRLNLQQRHDEDERELEAADFPDLATLRARWTQDETEMRAWIAGMTDADLAADVDSVQTRDRRPLWHYLIHIFTHAQQQQADAATALTHLGHSPGELGFVRWLHEKEAA